MAEKIQIRIAEITISVEWAGRDIHCMLHPIYKPFSSQGESDIILRLREAPQIVSLGEKIFDCSPVWTLYRGNGKLVITLFTNKRFPYSERVMLLHPSLRYGEIYVKKPPDSSSFTVDPLGGPTAELLMVHYLTRGHGILLHACGIELGGRGILFAGHSGAGKSTMARLLKDSGNIPILSDDRIIVRKKGGVFWMYGTPWHGEEEFASPRGCPLDRIYFINHARENTIRDTNAIGAISKLLTCSFPPFWNQEGMNFTLDLLAELSNRVPCLELGFLPDRDIIQFIKAMN